MIAISSVIVGAASTTSLVFAKKIATLSGDQVVPPVNTTATGTAVFRHPNDTAMSYKVNITGIHHVNGINVNLGKRGINGAVIIDLMKLAKAQPTKLGMIITGSFTKSDLTGPMAGKTILDLVSSMKSGDTYIRVNTDKHITGEIRGQIEMANPPGLNKINSVDTGNQSNMTK